MKANRIQVFSVAAILGTDSSIFYENYESRAIRAHDLVIWRRVIYHQTTSPHVTLVLNFLFYNMTVTVNKLKNIMRPQGFEQSTFWSGVRRATIAPQGHLYWLHEKIHIKIHCKGPKSFERFLTKLSVLNWTFIIANNRVRILLTAK